MNKTLFLKFLSLRNIPILLGILYDTNENFEGKKETAVSATEYTLTYSDI